MTKAPDSKGKKRTRRSAEEAKRLILDAAERRLHDAGPEAIRLQDIASDVGISHPAILHHFGSRDGLVSALGDRALERTVTEMLGVLSEIPATEDNAAELIHRTFEALTDSGVARLLIWQSLTSNDTDPDDPVFAMLVQIIDVAHERRTQFAEENGRPIPDREDTESLVRLVITAVLGDAIYSRIWSAHPDMQPSPQTMQRHFRDWFSRLVAKHLEIPLPDREDGSC